MPRHQHESPRLFDVSPEELKMNFGLMIHPFVDHLHPEEVELWKKSVALMGRVTRPDQVFFPSYSGGVSPHKKTRYFPDLDNLYAGQKHPFLVKEHFFSGIFSAVSYNEISADPNYPTLQLAITAGWSTVGSNDESNVNLSRIEAQRLIGLYREGGEFHSLVANATDRRGQPKDQVWKQERLNELSKMVTQLSRIRTVFIEGSLRATHVLNPSVVASGNIRYNPLLTWKVSCRADETVQLEIDTANVVLEYDECQGGARRLARSREFDTRLRINDTDCFRRIDKTGGGLMGALHRVLPSAR